MNKGTIIFTFDDVLAMTTYHLYEYLLANIKKYDHILDLFKFRTKSDIYNRPEKNFLYSIVNKKVVNEYVSKSTAVVFINMMLASLYNDYYNNQSCNDLELTNITNKVLNNPIFTETQGIQRIVIIFKYKTDQERLQKNNFLNNKFNNQKIEIIPMKFNKNYYDIIRNKISEWDLLVTDDIITVENLAKDDIDHKEFLLPRFGYNKASPELIELIKQKSATISYYEIEK